MRTYLLSVFTSVLLLYSCKQEQVVEAVADFEYTITDSSYTVPVNVRLNNKSTAAQYYQWTFDGAVPSQSTDRNPGTITYQEAGSYTLRLEAWNDDSRSVKELSLQLDSAVTVDFTASNLINDFAPAQFRFENLSTGGSSFKWLFENGSPSFSDERIPPVVTFPEGRHSVMLEVGNGREVFTHAQTVTVQAALHPSFDLSVSFDDDYEAPLRATLHNTTISGIRWRWTADGGQISDTSAHSPDIYFEAPGNYTVILSANNDKETKTATQAITVKPNRNLRTLTGVKLGINTAHQEIGCFYSTNRRKVYNGTDDLSECGAEIDIVFFGLNATFWKNSFVSPDSVQNYTFTRIPDARNSIFINSPERIGYSFSAADFDRMTDDNPLQALRFEDTDEGRRPFGNTLPHIVLFRTADGRKGAIKVTHMEADELQSYIIVDIKIQKEAL